MADALHEAALAFGRAFIERTEAGKACAAEFISGRGASADGHVARVDEANARLNVARRELEDFGIALAKMEDCRG
jgi:hypothetical protein